MALGQCYSSVWDISCHALRKPWLEILRSSFCEQVIRHGSEKIVCFKESGQTLWKNITQHCYIRRQTNSGPNKNCSVFTPYQQRSQMLIVLRNCSLYIFHGIGDIYCIGVHLHIVRVDVFSVGFKALFTLWCPGGGPMFQLWFHLFFEFLWYSTEISKEYRGEK